MFRNRKLKTFVLTYFLLASKFESCRSTEHIPGHAVSSCNHHINTPHVDDVHQRHHRHQVALENPVRKRRKHLEIVKIFQKLAVGVVGITVCVYIACHLIITVA